MKLKQRLFAVLSAGALMTSSMIGMNASALGMAPLVSVSPIVRAAASVEVGEYRGTNIGRQNYTNWSATVKSYLTAGNSKYPYMRVQAGASDGNLVVQYLDERSHIMEEKTVKLALPVFGAFFETADNYYVLTGQGNPTESDSIEVFRITKYDKDWKELGHDGLFGANTYIPFDAGSARMDYANGYLIIRTSHEMYKSSDGKHHQSNVTILVNTGTMKITESLTKVADSSRGYVSHSFNQFVKLDGENIVAIDHGDAYPRSIVLSKYLNNYTTGKFVPAYSDSGQIELRDVIAFDGNTGENYTGASVGGFEISGTSYLVAGNTIDQSNFRGSNTRNIFVAAAPKTSGAFTVTKITNYAEGTASASTPQFVKISDNRFLLLWTHDGKINYTEIDGAGKQVGRIYTMDGDLSDCAPQVIDGKVTWYTWNNSDVYFYEIDASEISSAEKIKAHVLDEEKNVVAPTCTEGGYTEHTCAECDYTYTDDETEALGHDPKKGKTVEPTCTEGGYTIYTCSRCEDSYEDDETEALGHNYEKEEVAATCTKGGYSVYTCSRCEDSYNDDETEALGHNFVEDSVVEATCTEGGHILYACTRCDETKKEITSEALGHDFVKGDTVAPTCTEAGYTVYKCSRCDKSEHRDAVAALDHDFVKGDTVAPTCTEAGYTVYKCSRCDESEKRDAVEALGHDFVKGDTVAPTCTEAGYTVYKCSRCDVSEQRDPVTAHGHNYHYEVTREPTETEEGERTGTCEFCGDVVREPIPATGSSSSDSSTPDSSTPDSSTPDSSTPDSSTPDSSTPDSSTPDSSTPDSSTPDSSTPDSSTPDSSGSSSTTSSSTTSSTTSSTSGGTSTSSTSSGVGTTNPGAQTTGSAADTSNPDTGAAAPAAAAAAILLIVGSIVCKKKKD